MNLMCAFFFSSARRPALSQSEEVPSLGRGFQGSVDYCYGARTSGRSPWGETPRVADSSAAGASRFQGSVKKSGLAACKTLASSSQGKSINNFAPAAAVHVRR